MAIDLDDKVNSLTYAPHIKPISGQIHKDEELCNVNQCKGVLGSAFLCPSIVHMVESDC